MNHTVPLEMAWLIHDISTSNSDEVNQVKDELWTMSTDEATTPFK